MKKPVEKALKEATLVFLVRNGRVLLAVKTRHIGKGRRNGLGGGFEGGETPVECVIREAWQEAKVRIVASSLVKMAEVTFHNTKSDGSKFSCLVHVFIATEWRGETKESEEMKDPRWFRINRLPLKKLMPADPFWLPLVLNGKKIIAEAWYGPYQKELLKPVAVKEVVSF